MDSIDRYEAQQIAEQATSGAVSAMRQEVRYDLDRVVTEIRDVARDLRAETASRREVVREIWEAISNLDQRLRRLEVTPTSLRA